MKIRAYLKKTLKQAGISRVVIERPHKKCRVTIYSARPGVVIGKKGADIEKLRRDISKMTGRRCISTSSRYASPRSTPSWWRRTSPSSSSAGSPSAAP
jgi:predicted metal-dependent RNase